MKPYTVYLFHCKDPTVGWLAYMAPNNRHSATVTVEIEAKSASDAKKCAILLANRGFVGLKILDKNYNDKHWGINNYPELWKMMERL